MITGGQLGISIKYVATIIYMYSRISISRTRISRILRSSKRLSESKYILIAFSNTNLALGTFLQVQLSEVQIDLHFG